MIGIPEAIGACLHRTPSECASDHETVNRNLTKERSFANTYGLTLPDLYSIQYHPLRLLVPGTSAGAPRGSLPAWDFW